MTVVVPGHDDVAHPGHRPIGQGQTRFGHQAGGHPVGAGPAVQLGHRGVVHGQHERGLARLNVGFPGLIAGGQHLVPVALGHPAVAQVGVYGTGRAGPQLGAGVPFPGLGKAPGLGQLGRILAVVDEHGKGPSRPHRAQLRPISNKQELRPRSACLAGQAVESEGTSQRRFVNQE